jgi:ATP-dependent exoDNAse (exonuclease V) beta subunit
VLVPAQNTHSNAPRSSDGKTLFLVGDPMQSIYRFRESQVGLFLQVKEEGIASIQPKQYNFGIC